MFFCNVKQIIKNKKRQQVYIEQNTFRIMKKKELILLIIIIILLAVILTVSGIFYFNLTMGNLGPTGHIVVEQKSDNLPSEANPSIVKLPDSVIIENTKDSLS